MRKPSIVRQNCQKYKNRPCELYFFYETSKTNMPRVVLDEEFKTGLCVEIRQRQQKCWRKPKVQSLANPAVIHVILCQSNLMF